jgi:hypothetical protein
MNKIREHPVFISGVGFFICLASFLLAALLGKSVFTTAMFYVGFGVGCIGVLIGFFAFRQSEK